MRRSVSLDGLLARATVQKPRPFAQELYAWAWGSPASRKVRKTRIWAPRDSWSFQGAKSIVTLRTILLSKTWDATYDAYLKCLYPIDLQTYRPKRVSSAVRPRETRPHGDHTDLPDIENELNDDLSRRAKGSLKVGPQTAKVVPFETTINNQIHLPRLPRNSNRHAIGLKRAADLTPRKGAGDLQ